MWKVKKKSQFCILPVQLVEQAVRLTFKGITQSIDMKKVALLSLLLAGISFSGYSQENQETQPERIKLYPSTHQAQSNLSVEDEIANCDAQIQALDIKEAKIRESAEETKKATETGWFIHADETRIKLRKRIQELKSK